MKKVLPILLSILFGYDIPDFIGGESSYENQYIMNKKVYLHSDIVSDIESFDRDLVVIDFDDIEVSCVFNEELPLSDEYSDLGVTFEGVDGFNGGTVLHVCGGFGVDNFSMPNFLAFNITYTGTAQRINFINGPVGYVQISAGSVFEENPFIMNAYSADDALIATVQLDANTSVSPMFIETSGISYVIVEKSGGDYWVLDDLIFEPCNGGDLNSDDVINVLDVVVLLNCILESDCNSCSDLNSDGIINILDVINLINLILEE